MPVSEQDIALAARLSGEETPEQRLRNDAWIDANRTEWNRLQDVWNMVTPEDFQFDWPVKSHPSFRKKIVNRRRLIAWTSMAASLILIAMISFFLIRENEVESFAILNETSTSAGQQKEITLPDGTMVKLNAGTKIRYPQDFGPEMREVYLEGEAYFEVVSDKKRPLIVHGNEANVKVLGTAFNIRSFPNNGMEVAVRSGKVNMVSTYGESTEVLMIPMMKKGISNKARGIWEVQPATDQDFDWLEGKIIFDQTPLDEVVSELNRQFNCKIVLETPELSTCRISATFYRNSLEEVLETLSLIVGLQVEHREDASILLRGKGCR